LKNIRRGADHLGQLSASQSRSYEDWEKMKAYREKMGIDIH